MMVVWTSAKAKYQTKKSVEIIAKTEKIRIMEEHPVILFNESVPSFVATFIIYQIDVFMVIQAYFSCLDGSNKNFGKKWCPPF